MATTVAAQSIPRDANALWPGPDEDLRWRPGAFLDCHFARATPTNCRKSILKRLVNSRSPDQRLSEALVDAEQSALAAHRRALEQAGGSLRVITATVQPPDTERTSADDSTAGLAAADGDDDTAWTECVDHEHHPVTGKACRASFLDCFHCGNCLVSAKHLPRLLALLDALSVRRQQLSERDWWQRYGPAWAAIRHDILTKFTPAEIDLAAAAKPEDALLDLVEHPWQQP